MNLYRILYRGSLSSCNYSCDYCPFAKTVNSHEELRQDAQEVARFVNWVENSSQSLGILFTPWGEAIVHEHYRQAMVRLSHLQNVQRVSMQTNLSFGLEDLSAARAEKLSLWATFHPTQISLPKFLQQCEKLDLLGIRYSVGVVGLREHFAEIAQLRESLDSRVYLWINSYKREADYYQEQDLAFLRGVDPYFDLNRHYYQSQGKACRTGETVFTVDGKGDVRRCHFVDAILGNIYTEDIFTRLRPKACPNTSCGCHIGYVHRPELELDTLFGENVLERIPHAWPEINAAFLAPPQLQRI